MTDSTTQVFPSNDLMHQAYLHLFEDLSSCGYKNEIKYHLLKGKWEATGKVLNIHLIVYYIPCDDMDVTVSTNTLICIFAINTYIQKQNHAKYFNFIQLKLLWVTKSLLLF